jgi:Bacterial aa3 type cytochrome c oxidase subunit IV
MADNHEAEYVSTTMDYKAHEATYRGFLNMAKWTVAVIAVILIVLYFVVKP